MWILVGKYQFIRAVRINMSIISHYSFTYYPSLTRSLSLSPLFTLHYFLKNYINHVVVVAVVVLYWYSQNSFIHVYRRQKNRIQIQIQMHTQRQIRCLWIIKIKIKRYQLNKKICCFLLVSTLQYKICVLFFEFLFFLLI